MENKHFFKVAIFFIETLMEKVRFVITQELDSKKREESNLTARLNIVRLSSFSFTEQNDCFPNRPIEPFHASCGLLLSETMMHKIRPK